MSLHGGISNTDSRAKKVVARPQPTSRNWPRGRNIINANYCFVNVAGKKDSVRVIGKSDPLNCLSVNVASQKDCTCVTGMIKTVDSVIINKIKCVKGVPCVYHLISVQAVINVPIVAPDLPEGTGMSGVRLVDQHGKIGIVPETNL